MIEPAQELRRPAHRLLTELERQELLGGFRSLPARLALGAVTGLLLYLSGDMVGWWPLCWFAFVPLAFACRGAGAPAALLVALLVLTGASAAQTLWLLDGDQSPLGWWLAAGAFPALALASVELPFCTLRIPWPLRPLIAGAGIIGWYALLPPEAAPLLPLGGLIDSEFTRFAYPKLGLATFAGGFAALAWLAAEVYTRKGEGDRVLHGWPGMLAAGLLVLAGAIDGLGVRLAARPEPAGPSVRVTLVPQQPNMEAVTLAHLGPRARGGLVLWGVQVVETAAQREALVAAAGHLADQRQCTVGLVVAMPEHSFGYVFARGPNPLLQTRWDGAPGEARGEPLLSDGQGTLSLYPSLVPPIGWSTNFDILFCTTARQPLHPAQAAGWLREQRRLSLVRGGRQLCVWPGGGAIIDTQGRLLAQSTGQPVTAQLLLTSEMGEAMGKPRLTVVEKILRFSAPTMSAVLVMLSLVTWAKRRWRLRQQQPAEIALEEVYDGR